MQGVILLKGGANTIGEDEVAKVNKNNIQL